MFSEAGLRVGGLDTKWRAEYSTSKSALENGTGTVANSGEQKGDAEAGGRNIQFGTPVGTVLEPTSNNRLELHHLLPDTHYYARFIAENADGTAVLPFEFTTLPVALSEVAANTPIDVDHITSFRAGATSPTTARLDARIESNGASTDYSFGYSTSPGGAVTSCASGSISVVEDFAEPVAECTGLAPETTYYVHLLASNEKGTVEQTTYDKNGYERSASSFTTPTAKPTASSPSFRNVTAVSAHFLGDVLPKHEETRWRFESAPSALGPWTPVPGAVGTISQAVAEALPEGVAEQVGFTLAGLDPATSYYVRLFAENAAGEGENSFGEPVSTATRGFGEFQTTGPPAASTLAVHSLSGESPRVIGTVDPNSRPTSAEQTIAIEGSPTGGTFVLTFAGQDTVPIAYNAPAQGPGSVEKALDGLPREPNVRVEGPAGGPYTVSFPGGRSEPQMMADSSGLTPSGGVAVAVDQQGGEAYDASYHFQYVGEEQFEHEGEWAKAVSTPEVDVGSGTEPEFVGADLPGLKAGETYRYRIIATSTFPGDPVVNGEERTLAIPAPPVSEPPPSCANEALRSGASAGLPDCRGYEQVTPVDKGGTQELFEYGVAFGGNGAVVGEDGDHLALQAVVVNWGSGPEAGQSPYFFDRKGPGAWRMTVASPQPQTGVNKPLAQLFAPDLSGFALESSFATSPVSRSKEVEYEVGPPGGPYTAVASIPAKDASAWVGASQDFSKLFLETEDHALLGAATGTHQGSDIYEYAGGELRQANVAGSAPGSTIGACGANIVVGGEARGVASSVHAVSSDGSRVFFEAVPGSNCSEPKHLYMRVEGESTVDIGALRFVAANSEGTKLLLSKVNAGTTEVVLYDVGTAAEKPLFSMHQSAPFMVSEDLSTIYFVAPEPSTADAPRFGGNSSVETSLYRYDVPGEKLTYVDSGDVGLTPVEVSPDGRDLYFTAKTVAGVPGGLHTEQVYRYDSGESLIQCMSCASPFDPEPRLSALFGTTGGNGGILESKTGSPRTEFASSDGDYVFFDTPAALLRSDVDGEVAPNRENASGVESREFSLSSDVYEWRKPGVDGCVHVQGCLALITNGRGGFLNLFLGTDASGRDAFVYTRSELVPQDNDAVGDVYDARIGGGTPPPPPRPVECEGDACSTPASAPNDATPASFTFSGAGDVLGSSSTASATGSKGTPKKPPRSKTKTGRKKRRGAAKKRSAAHAKGRKAPGGHGKARSTGRSKS